MYNAIGESTFVQSLAAGRTHRLDSGIVLPIRRGVNDLFGVFNKGTFVEGAYFTIKVLPFDSIQYCVITATQIPYALDGDWENASFRADFPPATYDIGAQLIANNGVITIDAREAGPVRQLVTIENVSGGVLDIAAQLLVMSRNGVIVDATTMYTSPNGMGSSPAPALIRRRVQQTFCPVCQTAEKSVSSVTEIE